MILANSFSLIVELCQTVSLSSQIVSLMLREDLQEHKVDLILQT